MTKDELKLILRDWRLYVFGGIFLLSFFYVLEFTAPSDFPTGTIVTLKSGAGLSQLADELEKSHVVRSALWFRTAVIALGGESHIQAGDYYLKDSQNGLSMAWRMVKGEYDLTQVKITVPEGFTVSQISNLFDERFPVFNKDLFVSTAPEGYMFPDTYFIQVDATAQSVIDLFKKNYESKIANYKDEIANSGYSENEIITMASILEGEVKTAEDKKLVSGILWKRLSLGMPLQVDVDKSTYKTTGLPSAPVNNPGLTSIDAALNPTDSPYLYFISDKQGITHYAKTIDEQTANIQKYL